MHFTVVEAVQCAAQRECAPEIVAIEKGRAGVLSASEQRICDFITDYLALKRDTPPLENQASTLNTGLLSPESREQQLQLSPEYKHLRRRAFKSQYICPYAEKNCGDNASYCSRCNEDYAEFLTKIDERG